MPAMRVNNIPTIVLFVGDQFLQSTVFTSVTKSEYMDLTAVVKEAIWLQGLLDDLGVDNRT